MPPDVDQFVDDGFLEVLTELPNETTVEFHIPSKLSVDRRGRITGYRIVWIHPEYNADFCHYYDELPGDLPNFYVEVQLSNGPSEIIDDLSTDDDLSAWLEERQSTRVSA
jgi:hypothetical protein